MTDLVGQHVGNYHLKRLLGRGGFAAVYLGGHRHLGTQAAVKVLETSLVSQGEVARFQSEARTMARLRHRHIVPVLEFGIEGHLPFLVMAYAQSGSLRQRHPKGEQMAVKAVVAYVKQIADALDYIHRQRLVHRDMKPENLLLEPDNTVLVSAFGVAVAAYSSRSVQIQDEADGTLTYMAPEQIQQQPRRASDQYALGVIAYEWLSGALPFDGAPLDIATKQPLVEPPPLRKGNPLLPVEVKQVMLRAPRKDPKQRFPSVQAFADALEQASQAIPQAEHSTSSLARLGPALPAAADLSTRVYESAVYPALSAPPAVPPTEHRSLSLLPARMIGRILRPLTSNRPAFLLYLALVIALAAGLGGGTPLPHPLPRSGQTVRPTSTAARGTLTLQVNAPYAHVRIDGGAPLLTQPLAGGTFSSLTLSALKAGVHRVSAQACCFYKCDAAIPVRGDATTEITVWLVPIAEASSGGYDAPYLRAAICMLTHGCPS